MYNHSQKQQVRYSLIQLSKGLFYHMQNKDFDDITVTEICQYAEITRRTFYRNCENKTDLILFCADELVTDLLDYADFTCTDPYTLYKAFFDYWHQHRQFLTLIYKHSMFDMFLSEFLVICNRSMKYSLQEKSIEKGADRSTMKNYSNAFVVGGLGEMLRQWVIDGFSVPAEEVARSIVFLAPSAR